MVGHPFYRILPRPLRIHPSSLRCGRACQANTTSGLLQLLFFRLPSTLNPHLATMVATGLFRLVRTLVARTWPLHVQGMHGRVYGVVECKSRAFLCREIPNTSSGNISSKSRVTTQRSVRKLAGRYIYSPGIHFGIRKSCARGGGIAGVVNEYLTTRAGKSLSSESISHMMGRDAPIVRRWRALLGVAWQFHLVSC
jgi:hypothetical protein